MMKVQSWEVEVRVNGETVLTIGGEGASHVAGIENIDDYADTVRICAEHLRSFIGEPQSPAEDIRWQRVNDEPFEYAIQQGRFGDEFVNLLSGKRLRRAVADTRIDRNLGHDDAN